MSCSSFHLSDWVAIIASWPYHELAIAQKKTRLGLLPAMYTYISYSMAGSCRESFPELARGETTTTTRDSILSSSSSSSSPFLSFPRLSTCLSLSLSAHCCWNINHAADGRKIRRKRSETPRYGLKRFSSQRPRGSISWLYAIVRRPPPSTGTFLLQTRVVRIHQLCTLRLVQKYVVLEGLLSKQPTNTVVCTSMA